MDNVTHIYSVLREELNANEKTLKQSSKYNITNIKNFIKSSNEFNDYCSIIISDAFVLLNYNKKNSMITKEDKEIFDMLYKSFNISSFIFSTFLYNENNEILFSRIYELSHNFRNFNLFAKSKMFLSLDKLDISVLSHYNSQIKIDIKQYDLNLNMVKDYIVNTNNLDNLDIEFMNYLKFLYTDYNEKYASFKEEMEYTILYLDEDLDADKFEKLERNASSNNNLVSIEFVKDYINAIKNKNIKPKQYVK